MFTVYILYSLSGDKTYCGFTADIHRRVYEHNVSETKGFTLRYRPWTLIHTEEYSTKKEAMDREKYLKSGRGRNEVKIIVAEYLHKNKHPNRINNSKLN